MLRIHCSCNCDVVQRCFPIHTEAVCNRLDAVRAEGAFRVDESSLIDISGGIDNRFSDAVVNTLTLPLPPPMETGN